MQEKTLNLQSVLEYILTAISRQDPKVKVIDDKHVFDTHTGIKYHLYDTHSKVTHGDDTVLTSFDMTQDEQQVLWQIKELITPSDVAKYKNENYHELLRGRRKVFSDHYSSPSPVEDLEITPERNTVTYSR